MFDKLNNYRYEVFDNKIIVARVDYDESFELVARIVDETTILEKSYETFGADEFTQLLLDVTNNFYLNDGEELYSVNNAVYDSFGDFVNGLLKVLKENKWR